MSVISPPPLKQKFFNEDNAISREWSRHLEDMYKRAPIQSVTSTGEVFGSSRKDVTVTWQPAFKDLNFSVTATIEDTSRAGAGLRIERMRQKNLGSAIIQVINDSSSKLTGKIHVTAVHD